MVIKNNILSKLTYLIALIVCIFLSIERFLYYSFEFEWQIGRPQSEYLIIIGCCIAYLLMSFFANLNKFKFYTLIPYVILIIYSFANGFIGLFYGYGIDALSYLSYFILLHDLLKIFELKSISKNGKTRKILVIIGYTLILLPALIISFILFADTIIYIAPMAIISVAYYIYFYILGKKEKQNKIYVVTSVLLCLYSLVIFIIVNSRESQHYKYAGYLIALLYYVSINGIPVNKLFGNLKFSLKKEKNVKEEVKEVSIIKECKKERKIKIKNTNKEENKNKANNKLGTIFIYIIGVIALITGLIGNISYIIHYGTIDDKYLIQFFAILVLFVGFIFTKKYKYPWWTGIISIGLMFLISYFAKITIYGYSFFITLAMFFILYDTVFESMNSLANIVSDNRKKLVYFIGYPVCLLLLIGLPILFNSSASSGEEFLLEFSILQDPKYLITIALISAHFIAYHVFGLENKNKTTLIIFGVSAIVMIVCAFVSSLGYLIRKDFYSQDFMESLMANILLYSLTLSYGIKHISDNFVTFIRSKLESDEKEMTSISRKDLPIEDLLINTFNGQIKVFANEGYILVKYYLLTFLLKGVYVETKIKFKDIYHFALRLPTRFLFSARATINYTYLYRVIVLPTFALLPSTRTKIKEELSKLNNILKNTLDKRYNAEDKVVLSSFKSAIGEIILTNKSIITRYYPIPYLFKNVITEAEYYIDNIHLLTYMKMTKFLFFGKLHICYGNKLRSIKLGYFRILPSARINLSKEIDIFVEKYHELKSITEEGVVKTFTHAAGVITLTDKFLVVKNYPIPYLFRNNLTTVFIPLDEFKQFYYGPMTGFLSFGKFQFFYGPLYIPFKVLTLRILPSARRNLSRNLQDVYNYIDDKIN